MVRTGFTDLVILTSDDFTQTATNTAQTVALLNVHLGDIVRDAAIYLKTAFQQVADPAFNTDTIVIGDGNSTARFIASTEINVNGTEVYVKGGALTAPYAYTGDDTIDIVMSSMAAKALNDLDTGELWVWFNIARLAGQDH